jgi:hypothetical protein
MNGTGWKMKNGDSDVRILSPIDGVVVGTGSEEIGWYLKVKPDIPVEEMLHLLHPEEVPSWLEKEMARLQAATNMTNVGVSLADGGSIVADFVTALPMANWQKIWSEIFLES